MDIDGRLTEIRQELFNLLNDLTLNSRVADKIDEAYYLLGEARNILEDLNDA